MPDGTCVRLFEPFFTPREHGHGTGIGSWSVAGIVEASEGGIVVTGELGVGSAFHPFLPVADEADSTALWMTLRIRLTTAVSETVFRRAAARVSIG
jgi:K+-sensing histidine kinase KdpD